MEQLKKKFLSQGVSSILLYSLLGLILVGFGVLAYKIGFPSSVDKVEVLNNNTESPSLSTEMVVEIVGAVERAGVYKMKMGDRIDDLLITAGGISATADRGWVDKYINRAAKLIDGQKIYIYHSGEVSAKGSGAIKLDQGVLGSSNQNLSNLVNINTASLKELIELPEIAQERGKKIIENRFYSDTQELVTKGIITQKVFEKIKNAITVY